MAKFPELMNVIAQLKNETIKLTKEISSNDDQVINMVNNSIDGLECSLDVCNNPNREVQIPFTKIYTENLNYSETDKLMVKVADRFYGYKKSFEDSSQKVSEMVTNCRKKISGIKKPVEDIKVETENSYTKFKEAIDILLKPLTCVVEGFDVEMLRKKELKDKDKLKRLKELLDELKTTVEKYNTSLNGFNKDTLNLFQNVTQTDDAFSGFVETKMLQKVKEIPVLLNEGISLLPDVSRRINKFNENIKKEKGDTTEKKQDFYDKILTEVLKKTKNVDDQIYNSDKGIDEDFKNLNEKVTNVKSVIENNANAYNKYVKELKDLGKKIIEIVDEIRKLFDLEPLKINFDDKNIQYPFYEYAKKLNKGFEEIQEIKKEIQKPMKIVMVVFGKQINMVTLDLLFIMDITESMQDLLDETRNSIKYILDKIKRDSPGIDVRFAYEGYRDFADLKDGEKYYTIDFETDMDTFKKKLEGIVAKGGGDDAEDVAGGIFAGLNMSWRSNARYAVLIADAPGHGKQYHEDDVEDDYKNGDPNGHGLEDLMRDFAKKNINLCLTRIDDYTDKMYKKMIEAYQKDSQKTKDKPTIAVIEYDSEDDKKDKKKMGDLVAKTAIDIYNQYSKKDSISSS